jgi:hypothetical protein
MKVIQKIVGSFGGKSQGMGSRKERDEGSRKKKLAPFSGWPPDTSGGVLRVRRVKWHLTQSGVSRLVRALASGTLELRHDAPDSETELEQFIFSKPAEQPNPSPRCSPSVPTFIINSNTSPLSSWILLYHHSHPRAIRRR